MCFLFFNKKEGIMNHSSFFVLFYFSISTFCHTYASTSGPTSSQVSPKEKKLKQYDPRKPKKGDIVWLKGSTGHFKITAVQKSSRTVTIRPHRSKKLISHLPFADLFFQKYAVQSGFYSRLFVYKNYMRLIVAENSDGKLFALPYQCPMNIKHGGFRGYKFMRNLGDVFEKSTIQIDYGVKVI